MSLLKILQGLKPSTSVRVWRGGYIRNDYSIKGILFYVMLAACFLFFVGIVLQQPYLTGPEEFSWHYRTLGTYNKLWFPVTVFSFIILLAFLYINNYERLLNNKIRLGIFFCLLIVVGFLLQLSITFLTNEGISKIGLVIFSPGANGYFTFGNNIQDVPRMLKLYPEIILRLPVHADSHPPGGLLFFYAIRQFFERMPAITESLFRIIEEFGWNLREFSQLTKSSIVTLYSSGFLLPLLSQLTLIPIFFLAKNLFDNKTAVISSFFWILTPAFVLFTPELDQLLALFAVLSALLFYMGVTKQSRLCAILSGIVLSIGIFFSFILLVLVPMFFLFNLFYSIPQRDYNLKSFIYLISALAAFYVMSFFLFDFNIISIFIAVFKIKKGYYLGKEVINPVALTYVTWLFFNLYDFFVFVGIPVSFLFFGRLVSYFKSGLKQFSSPGFCLFASFFISLILFNLSGMIKSEVARLWIFLMPFVVLFASREMSGFSLKNNWKFYLMLAALFVFTVVCQEYIDVINPAFQLVKTA